MLAAEQPDDAEVRQPGPDGAAGGIGGDAVGAEQDVGGLDVAVHHVLGVHVGQRRGDLGGDLADLRLAQRALRDPGRQAGAVDQLHHQEGGLPVRPDRTVEQGDQVGVAQPGQRLQLELVALHATGDLVRVGVGAEDLDRDVAGQQLVVGAEHLGHAAGADPVDDPVTAAQRPAGLAGFRRGRRRDRLGRRAG